MLLIDCLEAVTNECALDNCNIVILGDLNVNMLKSNVLSDWLDISGLKNVIKEPRCKKGFTIIVRCINNKQTEMLTIQLIIIYWTKRLPQSCMRWNQISCIEAKKDQNILSELHKIRRNYVFTCFVCCPVPCLRNI